VRGRTIGGGRVSRRRHRGVKGGRVAERVRGVPDNLQPGHVKPRKRRREFLVFLRSVRSLYPPGVRLGLVLDNYSPQLSTGDDPRVGQWAQANNVELAYVPTNASWLKRIEAPVHRAAVLRRGRHRPRQPRRAGQHDPPLHRLAEPQCPRPPPRPDRQQGKRCLTRH
jgi:hypothetical protein